MGYIQDIRIDIAQGFALLQQPSFRALIMGSGAAAIPYKIISKAADLIAFGYNQTDPEYRKAEAFFSQIPSPADCAVVRKVDGDDWDEALTNLLPTFSDFWGVLITSDTEADLNAAGDWANANKKFFLGSINDTTYGDGRNVLREAALIYDKLSTAGYQEISSDITPFVGGDDSGLTAGTYHINIAVDGGSANDLSIVISGPTDDWDTIAAAIETALQTATSGSETVEIVDGYIKVTSATTGESSSIVITDGTGDDGGLLAAIDTLNDYLTSIETAVDGDVNHPDGAWMGRKLAKEPYLQWKWKQLNGIPSVDYNLTELNTIRTNKTNTVTEQAGAIFTNGGFTTGGSYIDIIYSIDYIESEMTLAILQLYLSNESVPLSDPGIAQVEAEIRGVLKRMGQLGIIASLNDESTDADRAKSDDGLFMFTVSVPKRSDISQTDRANRKLPNVEFAYTVAGAQDELEVSGILQV